MQIARVGEEVGEFAGPCLRLGAEFGDDPLPCALRQLAPPREQPLQSRQITERRIASEKFIAAETGERHLYSATAGQPTGVPGVDAVARGLIERGEDFGQIGGDACAGQDFLVMFGAEELGRLARTRLLGIPDFLETDRESFQVVRPAAHHQAGDGAGIHSAGEKRAHWNIRHAVGTDGVVELGAQTVDKL